MLFLKTKRKRRKYKNHKTEIAGVTFDSKGEAGLYNLLAIRQSKKEISEIKIQDVVYLTDARIMYKPDFRFINLATGKHEWAEYKGFETSDWKLKFRLWEHYGPGPLHVYKGYGNALKITDSLYPQGIEE